MTTEGQKAVQPGFLSTELANSITHGIGFTLSIAGLTLLVVMAALHGSARHVVACSVYGASLALLYLASTLYHALPGPKVKRIMRVIDQSAIYILIAGTYTPFSLCVLKGAWGWSTFGIIWGLAVAGIICSTVFLGKMDILSVVIYLAMGWMSVLIFRPLIDRGGVGLVAWLAGGGLCYSAGIIFYAWPSIKHHHAIWHLFVMLGSAAHFFGTMIYVIPWPE